MAWTTPRGRDAVGAWRALHPDARTAAWAAARRGAAAPGVDVGVVAAGYGATVAQALLIATIAGPLTLFAVLTATIVLTVALHAPAALFTTVLPVGIIPYVAAAIFVRALRRRYLRLCDSGHLALEAAHLGVAVSAPVQTGWAGPYQSEYTVPYQFPPAPQASDPHSASQPGGLYPAGSAAASAPRAGGSLRQSVEIRARRDKILASLALMLVVDALVGLRVLAYRQLHSTALDTTLEVLAVVLLCAYTCLVVVYLAKYVPLAVNPVVARFTPTGWDMPGLGVHGDWADVTAIRIRTARTQRRAPLSTRAPTTRIVVLLVTDPSGYLTQPSPRRRNSARSALRRFGSPAVIVASPQWTIGVVPLVRILRSYTTAAVDVA